MRRVNERVSDMGGSFPETLINQGFQLTNCRISGKIDIYRNGDDDWYGRLLQNVGP